MSRKKSSEAPKKGTDSLTEEQKATYRLIKWAYNMSESCKRASENINERNKVRLEFSSAEAARLYKEKANIYEGIVSKFCKDTGITLDKLLSTRL